MISKERRARIRRLFFAEHWKVGTIANELGVHPDTVKRAIESDRFAPKPRRIRPTQLDPYKEFINRTLETYPKLRSTRLHEMLQQRGYPGSVIQLRRYVKTVRPTKREAYMRLETLPGEQGQTDWGHFGKITVGSARRDLSCFVMALSYSRAIFARFFLNQMMESFLRGHVEAFDAFGGVPREVLYDNLKSAVTERDGELVRFHPRLLELAGHYHFAPKACAPYRGNEKGKVERVIRYIRDSFFAARSFHSLEHLNAQLKKWIAEIAHTRPAPGDPSRRPVAEVFAEEQPRLLPLPENPISTELLQPVRSGKRPYVRFDKNDYSIPHTLTRQSLTLAASETRVRILDANHDTVAEHVRSYDRGQYIEDEAHLRDLARYKRRAGALPARQRIMSACPHAAPFFAELAARDEPLRGHVTRLGRLLDAYGEADLDAAFKEAVQRGAISSASVAHILDQKRREQHQPPPLMPVLSTDPRVHSLRVTPHSLASYDELAATDADLNDDACKPDNTSQGDNNDNAR